MPLAKGIFPVCTEELGHPLLEVTKVPWRSVVVLNLMQDTAKVIMNVWAVMVSATEAMFTDT